MNKKLITETDFNRLKNIIKENKKIEIYSSIDDDLNRKVAEKIPIEVLAIPLKNRKDFSKQKNSGLNQVITKIMKKKEISLGVFIDELIPPREEIIGRLKQNIFLCKKEKINISFLEQKNKREIYELKAILSTLKADTKTTHNAEIIKI